MVSTQQKGCDNVCEPVQYSARDQLTHTQIRATKANDSARRRIFIDVYYLCSIEDSRRVQLLASFASVQKTNRHLPPVNTSTICTPSLSARKPPLTCRHPRLQRRSTSPHPGECLLITTDQIVDTVVAESPHKPTRSADPPDTIATRSTLRAGG
jgi:hypothetical protein